MRIIFTISTMILILFFIKLSLSQGSYQEDSHYVDLLTLLQYYKIQNRELCEEIYIYASYTEIASKSASMGFIENKYPIFLGSDVKQGFNPF